LKIKIVPALGIAQDMANAQNAKHITIKEGRRQVVENEIKN